MSNTTPTIPGLYNFSDDSDKLPRWAMKLALRAAQIINESDPGEFPFVIVKHDDGRIGLKTPPSPEMLGRVDRLTRQR